ncbi:MAG: hypothetical protein LBH46_02050, partial [Rickettsiales bacterium]|nr:hypothetical protein [Rickettsiales bacterium]
SLYHYVIRNGSLSATNTHVPVAIDNYDSIIVLEELYKYYKDNNLLDKFDVPLSWDYPIHLLEKHINKNELFNRYRNFFISCKDDVLSRRHIFSEDRLRIFYDVLSKDNYLEWKMNKLMNKINSLHHLGNNSKTKIKLFGILPLLKIKTKNKNNKIISKYLLFGFIPLVSLKKRW